MPIVFEATAVATFDNLAGGNFQRIFELSNDAGTDKIWLGNDNRTSDITFQVQQDGARHSVTVTNAITQGVSTEWRVTIDDTGQMTIFADGVQIGTQNNGLAAVPNDVPRTQSLIGDSLHAANDPLIGKVASVEFDTTLSNGFDFAFTDTLNVGGTFAGTDQAETLDASARAAAITIEGGAGNDTIIGGAGSDSLIGAAGNDFFDASATANGDDTLLGGAGNDTIQHDLNDDIVDGGDGDDYIANVHNTGSAGITTITGGNGTDTYALDNSEGAGFSSGQVVNLSIGYVTFNGALRDVLSGIENVEIIAAASGVIGDAGDNVITATGDFANLLDGGAGNDSINAGGGNDTLIGGDGRNTLQGGDGNDSLVGNATNGGSSTNMEGGAGADTIDGSAGNWDIASYYSSTDAVNIDLTDGVAESGGDALGDTLTGIEQINGSLLQGDTIIAGTRTIEIQGFGGNDSLVGSAGRNTILGGGGADTLRGEDGDDSIDGGSGNDVIIGGLGGDTITGGDGDDYIEGGDGADLLRTGAGRDTLIGGAGNDTLLNSVGDDSLVGGAGDDSIVATWGDDTLQGDGGNDTLIGGADNDRLEGGAGADTIYSGSRNVAGEYSEQTGTADSFTGTNGNGNFTGTVSSNEGSVEQMTLGALSGYNVGNTDGNEVHSHVYTQPVAGVRVDFNALNTDEQLSFAIDGVRVDLNTLIANGDAVFNGAPDYEVNGSGQVVLSSGGNVVQVGSVTFLRPLTDIDVIATGTSGGGFVYEMHVDTNPPTYSDNDTLSGGDDADTFIIQDAFGSDAITGGEGGTDHDVIDLNALSGPVTVTYGANGAETGTITDGIDTLKFNEIEQIILTNHNDSIDASASHDGVRGDEPGINADGRDGDDTIVGGRGGDTIDGGTGADSIVGNYGDDSLTGGDGNDTIYGDGSDGSDFGNDTIDGGAGNDLIDGGMQSDSLTGGAGDDTIRGGDGDDTLIGGAGNDSLTGGDGNDTFTFNLGDGQDTITDFNFGNTGLLGDADTTNNDFIDLSQYYTTLTELRSDFADDGVLNQSDTVASDYSDNTALDGGDGITFSGATNDSFRADNTGVVCFAAGTMILTDKGEIAVERLRANDRIVTYDNGLQPLAMVASRRLRAHDLARNPELKPIELKAGALGGDAPLVVSPQHMMLINHGNDEALVRARQLSRLKGGAVRVMEGCRQVTYFHLIFDAHQIVFANKRPAESFYPGPRALAALDADARHEFLQLFPDLDPVHSGMARPRPWKTARDGIRRRSLPEAVASLSSPCPLRPVFGVRY